MSELIRPAAEVCAALIEALGIAVITLIALYGILGALVRLLRKEGRGPVYQELRLRLGRGILLGLEFLIAADIIHTVAVELTFETLGVLAVVVLIRTFLSFTLEMELSGRWPWQSRAQPVAQPGGLAGGELWK